jgi:small subunit ribosomal protein S2
MVGRDADEFCDHQKKHRQIKLILKLQKERDKLDNVLGGIRRMRGFPGGLFVVDPKRETIGVKEARKLKIPIVGIVDSNCDPDEIDYIIPGNDDAIRAIKLFASKFADAVIEGRKLFEERLQAASNKEASAAQPEVDISGAEYPEVEYAESDVPESVETKDGFSDN